MGAAWPKKSVVQSERGARRAWCADEVETKKRRGGRGARGVWCERSAWCKASGVQGEQRGARRAAWCNESVVRKKRGQRWETREKGAAAACRPTGRLPRLVGACGASRSVPIARRATFTKAGRRGRVVQSERGARRAWRRDERVLSVVQGERGAKEEGPK